MKSNETPRGVCSTASRVTLITVIKCHRALLFFRLEASESYIIPDAEDSDLPGEEVVEEPAVEATEKRPQELKASSCQPSFGKYWKKEAGS